MSKKIEFPKNGFSFYDLLKMSKATSDKEINIVYVSSKLKIERFSPEIYTDFNIFKGGFLQATSFNSNFLCLINLFSGLGVKNDFFNLINFFNKSNLKPSSRTKLIFNDDTKICLSIINNNFIVSHYTHADIYMLSDFEELKTKLSVVAKSIVTLGKPLRFERSYV